MSDPFVGEIRLFGFNFAPVGWAICNGQTLSISANTALFSLLGTTYGGNGTTTFVLPDLRSRVPIGAGQGAGLSSYNQGQTGGQESITEVPTHSHGIPANGALGTTDTPAGSEVLAGGGSYASSATTSLAPTDSSGESSVGTLPPYLALNYCIALEGIFPSRS